MQMSVRSSFQVKNQRLLGDISMLKQLEEKVRWR